MPGKGKPFQKGNQNSKGKGRPKGTGGLGEIKSLNAREVALKLQKLSSLPVVELTKMNQDKTIPYMDALLIKIALTAVTTGDVFKTNFILDRMIGKVPDIIHLTGAEGEPLHEKMDLSKLTTEQLKVLEGILPDPKKIKEDQ